MLLRLLIDGIVTGSLYALAGMGVIVIYKASGVVNFAQGDMAMAATFFAYVLLTATQLPFAAALALTLVAAALFGALTQFVIVRPIQERPVMQIVVATLGYSLILNGAAVAIFGSEPRAFPPIVPGTVAIGELVLSRHELAALAIALLALGAVYLFFTYTKLGMIFRATYQNPMVAGLMGVNVRLVGVGVWALGTALGALSGVLLAPRHYLDANVLDQIMIAAIVAVVLGGFGSIPGAVVGGITLGIAQNLIGAYLDTHYQSTAIFLILLAILAVRPYGLFGKRSLVREEKRQFDFESRAQRVRFRAAGAIAVSPLARRVAGAVLVLALVAAPLYLAGYQLSLLSTVAVAVPAVLSLTVLTGYTGQISLGQAAFVAIGAFTTAILGAHLALPFPLLMLASIAVAAVVGLIVGLVASRLSGLYLAIATLGFGWTVPELAVNAGSLTGGYSGLQVAPPSFFGWSLGTNQSAQYLFALACAGAALLLTWRVLRSPLGRAWKAVRDSETGAISIGLDPAKYRIAAFVYASALAGFAGAMYAFTVAFVSASAFSFWHSVFYLAGAVIGGIASPAGAVLGALLVTAVPFFFSGVPAIPPIVLGAAVFLAVVLLPSGLAGFSGSLLAGKPKPPAPVVSGVSAAT